MSSARAVLIAMPVAISGISTAAPDEQPPEDFTFKSRNGAVTFGHALHVRDAEDSETGRERGICQTNAGGR